VGRVTKGRHRSCMFCDQRDSPPSDEDVLAKWVARLWPKGAGFRVDFETVGEATAIESFQAPKGTLGLIVKRPCRRCNNGWMSQLENLAKPILTPMILGRVSSVAAHGIALEHQIVIARWLLKVAMAYEFLRGRQPRFYSRGERLALMQGSIPERTGIWAGYYTGERVARTIDTNENIPLLLSNGVTGSAYSFTLSLGRLVLQSYTHRFATAVHGRYTFRYLAVWNEMSVELWPRATGNVRWPPPYGIDDDRLSDFADRWAKRGTSE